MTPLALSGGCQASEMVCLVMSFAWMDVTGEGAGELTKKEKEMELFLNVFLTCSSLFSDSGVVHLFSALLNLSQMLRRLLDVS